MSIRLNGQTIFVLENTGTYQGLLWQSFIATGVDVCIEMGFGSGGHYSIEHLF